jgi:hypothetical protein
VSINMPDSTTLSRLAVSRKEAAYLIGVSLDFFDEHVAPELRTVIRSRRRLIPIVELERWLEKNAAVDLDPRWTRG